MTGVLSGPHVHGSAVAFPLQEVWVALLIIGRSGAGKSELALELMGLGAMLVSDDQTLLTRQHDHIAVSPPVALRGLIELRGMGILRAPCQPSARLAAIVDLDDVETRRLPEEDFAEVHGLRVARLRKSVSTAFAVGLKYYLLSGDWQPEGRSRHDTDTFRG